MKTPAKHWTPIWSQAMAKALINGQSYKNKTSCFRFKAYMQGKRLRLRFSNVSGKSSVLLGSVILWKNNIPYVATLDEKVSIVIPKGEVRYSDIIQIPIEMQDEIEVRMYFKTAVVDLNHTELNAKLFHSDQTKGNTTDAKQAHSNLGALMGIYTVVPTLDRIEIETNHEPKVIVAFGDSITAMNHWVKPLRERIHQLYHEDFCLMNAGISGNCLLYEIMRPFANLFGRKGVDRFEYDVLKNDYLHTVIFALGINDMSYYHKKTKNIINFDNYTKALMKIADQVHARNARIVVCTLTPRIGFKLLKFTAEMEALRIQINEWMRMCGYFDEIFDMDAVIRDTKHLNVIDERYHIGDHLHPNSVGGQKIADAFNLEQLLSRKGESK